MTTQTVHYEYLSKGHMRQAMLQVSKEMFGSRDPIVERIRQMKVEDFSPGTAPAIFAGAGRLGEGMGKLLFQATDAEALAEKQVRRVLTTLTGNDLVSISTSIMAILMNTKNDGAFLYATEAAMEYVQRREHPEYFLDGSMACAKEFLRVCAQEEFGFPEIVLGSEHAKREPVADTARMVARVSKDDWGPNSYFHGILKIVGVSFAEDKDRYAAVENYRAACERLARHCVHVIASFAYHIGVVSREQCDGERVNTLSELFGNDESLFLFRRFCKDPDRIVQISDGISRIVRGETVGGMN